MVVDGEKCASVVGDGLGGFDLGRPGAVAGVVGRRDDVSVFFGAGLESVDRAIAARRGIEGVDDGPFLGGCVRCGDVESVGLGGLGGARTMEFDLAGDGRRWLLLSGGDRAEKEEESEEATHGGEV